VREEELDDKEWKGSHPNANNRNKGVKHEIDQNASNDLTLMAACDS
jgi:hypothetical protein